MNEETKIAVTQERVQNLERNVDKIMNNHLPHLHEEIEAVKEEVIKLRITVARGGAAVVAAVAIIDVLVKVVSF